MTNTTESLMALRKLAEAANTTVEQRADMASQEFARSLAAIRAFNLGLTPAKVIELLDAITELEQDKRELCEVIAALVLQQGGTITVTPDTQARVHPKLWIQISQSLDGQTTYQVGEGAGKELGPLIKRSAVPPLHTHTWILRGGRDVCFTCDQPRPIN